MEGRSRESHTLVKSMMMVVMVMMMVMGTSRESRTLVRSILKKRQISEKKFADFALWIGRVDRQSKKRRRISRQGQKLLYMIYSSVKKYLGNCQMEPNVENLRNLRKNCSPASVAC